jgi:hypothetical protein
MVVPEGIFRHDVVSGILDIAAGSSCAVSKFLDSFKTLGPGQHPCLIIPLIKVGNRPG